MANSTLTSEKLILAFVGMPGAGKSEAATYLEKKGIPFIRFGNFTEEAIKAAGLPVTTENERIFREKIRQDHGMGAFAVLAEPKIKELLEKNNHIAIDGLYSWEEYTFLRDRFPFIKLILVYAEPEIRYRRLSQRKIRPVELSKAYSRDVNELEKLNKGGPIAIADFAIENNQEDLSLLYEKIDKLLNRLGIA